MTILTDWVDIISDCADIIAGFIRLSGHLKRLRGQGGVHAELTIIIPLKEVSFVSSVITRLLQFFTNSLHVLNSSFIFDGYDCIVQIILNGG